MAINPGTSYPGRVTAASTGYPYSSSKNETSPGAGDGTPYELARANDVFGMQQALLKSVGIVPSGTADAVRASQYLQAIVALASGRASLYAESGVADAYVLDPINADSQGPAAYFDGMVAIFAPGNANTGAATANVDGLGIVAITDKAGTALAAGVLVVGHVVQLRYDAGLAGFVLVEVQDMDLTTETLPFTFAGDANDALTAAENLFGRINITGATLTAPRNLDVSNVPRILFVTNGEGFPVTVKTSAGTGVAVSGGDNAMLACDGVNVVDLTPSPVAAALPLLHVQDQKTSGTVGGTSVAGTQTRVLNTVLTNEISGVSLAANQLVNVPAGTYEVSASVPAANVAGHQASLYDVTGAATLLVGASCSTNTNGVVTHSFITGRFTLAVTSTLEVRHFTTTAIAAGLGVAATSGLGEVYTDLKIEKVS